MIKKIVVVLFFTVMQLSPNFAQEYQKHFPPEEFQTRWEKVFEKIGENAVAIIQGAADPGGFVYPRQTNTFYYLCGVENSYSYLLLDGKTQEVSLYMPGSRDRGWERVLNTDDSEKIKKFTGVHHVKNVDELKQIRSGLIFTPFTPAEGQGQSRGELNSVNRTIASDYWDGRISKEAHFISLLRTRNMRAEIKDLSPIIDEMRSIKSPREIELLRRAGQLAALAINEAIKSSEIGIYEYQLDAAARYVFLVNGSRLEGYRSITASGVKNIGDGHYYYNSSQLKDDDLVLMDYAPDYGYYTSDIGRMWPVNGKFNNWQRQLCQIILDYHKVVLERIRPGVTPAQIMDEAKVVMEKVFNNTKFLKPEYEKACRKMVETGGGVFSHPVGMAVHDDGRYGPGPLKPGHVFAVDPQLRVPEEGLYMRIEDTVVVTDDGVENLTRFAPSELDDIEKMMKEKGIVQLKPYSPPVKEPRK